MGNNYWTHPPFFSRHLVPQNVGNITFVCYFLNIGLGSKKVNGLGTSPKNQIRDYFIWNRIEKLMPQLWNFSPQTLKTLQKTTNLFSNLDFWPKSGFPKTRDLSRQPPGGFIFPEMTPKTKYFPIILANHQKTSFFDKMASFFMPGEPLGRMWGNRSAGLPERIPYKESKNPFRQAWLGKNLILDPHMAIEGVLTRKK